MCERPPSRNRWSLPCSLSPSSGCSRLLLVLAGARTAASPQAGFSTPVSTLPGAAARLAPAVRVAGRKNPGPSGFQHQEAVMTDTDVSRTPQSSAKRALAALNDELRTDTTNPGHNRLMMTEGRAALTGEGTRVRGV